VERCLAKDPAERYASTYDLARDLAHLRDASLPIVARRKNATWRAWRLAALGLGIIAAGLAAALLLSPGALRQSAAKENPGPTFAALHLPDVRTFANEVVTPFAILPDGRRIIIHGSGGRHLGLFLRDLRSTVATPLPGTENGYAPALSPDGTQVAFFASGKLKIASLKGGPPRVLGDAGEGDLSWGPNDTILLARRGEWGTAIFAVKASGGTPVPLRHLRRGRERVFQRFPELLPDGKNFLYLSVLAQPGKDQSGRRHILMAASLEGGTPKEVGPIDSRVLFHDGKLLFVRDGTLMAQTFDIGSMSLQGDPVPIVDGVYNYTSSGVAAFAISKTGTVIYRRPRTESSLVWYERSGMQGDELARIVLGRQPGSISHDGQQYATGVMDPKTGSQDLWIYDFARKTSTRLTYGDADDTRPVWSADARTLFFRSDSADGGGPPDVYRLDVVSGRREVVVQGADVEEPSDVSPDGKHLLIERFNEASGNDIMIASLESGAVTDFVRTPFQDDHAQFSPDGKWVAHSSAVSGRAEVQLLRFPERGSPVRVSTEGGTLPRWRSDGRELFYVSGRRIMSVEVRTVGSAIELGESRFLFRSATPVIDFDVLPDGSRFLLRGPEDKSPEVYLVLNALPAAR
jgi:eukaryotic-like serine/threonine-protein kinase